MAGRRWRRPSAQRRASRPTGLATSIIADTGNQRIRRVDPDGIITTVAGSGERGYAGDGGPALEAALNDPVMLAVDERDGTIYFADHHNHVVRRGESRRHHRDRRGHRKEGLLGRLRSSERGDARPALGIAIHDGVLYIADMGNNRVRMVVP